MVEHTKICKMVGFDDPKHLVDCDALLPNIFLGMCISVNGTKYRVRDIRSIVDKDFCRQVIVVE